MLSIDPFCLWTHTLTGDGLEAVYVQFSAKDLEKIAVVRQYRC